MTGKSPVCSVCIANYNGMAIIESCLDSVLNQKTTFPFEIIVHDDASSDNSAEFIKHSYPEARLIQSSENVGFCLSNNRMAARAKGRYLLLLNNDTELFPDALQCLYEAAETDSTPTILGIRQFSARTGELIDLGIDFDPFLNSVPNVDLQREQVGMILGACLWLPRHLWNELGGFPNWFHTMHEDMYICCLARLRGNDVKVISQSGYKHWIGQSLGGGKVQNDQISTSINRRYLSERNRIYVMGICYPGLLLWGILPLHLLLLMAEGLLLALVKKNKKLFVSIYLTAFRDAWRNRQRIRLVRLQTQKKRAVSCKKFISVFYPMPHKLRMLIKYGFPEVR